MSETNPIPEHASGELCPKCGCWFCACPERKVPVPDTWEEAQKILSKIGGGLSIEDLL